METNFRGFEDPSAVIITITTVMSQSIFTTSSSSIVIIVITIIIIIAAVKLAFFDPSYFGRRSLNPVKLNSV